MNKEILPLIYTIGHSTLSIEEFIQLLQAYSVMEVIDIRTVPQSRHNPQFDRETLPDALKTPGISYKHFPELGGLRHPRPDSQNTGWRNLSFRGFADYMQTYEFEKGLERLIETGRNKRIALMCAEAVPWRCHRSLIADALFVRNVKVEHILSISRSLAHSITQLALVNGISITYPRPEMVEIIKE
jgi:uncharacterized protein (DUF488 family)